jgi:transposase
LALLDSLPKADWLLADRGYDADWFREALADKGIKPCIPGRQSRERPIKHDKRRTRRRHRIEMMFGRLKDWRRVATRYDRCPIVFLSEGVWEVIGGEALQHEGAGGDGDERF